MSNMVVRTNVMALNSHRNLGMTGTQQRNASARLSSGFRINSAADDAAGLAISEKMRGQIRGLNQASRNASDGISLIQTAEGAMQTINEMVIRVRELVIQAANDTNVHENARPELSDRGQIQREIDQLLDEIDAVTERTEFNTRTLLDGSWGTLTNIVEGETAPTFSTLSDVLNAGGGTPESLDDLITRMIGDSAFDTSALGSAASGAEFFASGGTIVGLNALLTGSTAALAELDTWVVNAGLVSQDGTPTPVNNWADLVSYLSAPGTAASIFTSNGVGVGNLRNIENLRAVESTATESLASRIARHLQTTNLDRENVLNSIGFVDVAAGPFATVIAPQLGWSGATGGTQIGGERSGTTTFDQLHYSMTSGNGWSEARVHALFEVMSRASGFNLQNTMDLLIPAADLNAWATTQDPLLTGGTAFRDWLDVNALGTAGDVVGTIGGNDLWFQIGANQGQGIRVNIEAVNTRTMGIDGFRSGGAQQVAVEAGESLGDSNFMNILDRALAHVTGQRAILGAVQNRLEFTIDNLDTASENLSAAESRIRDADMALEMMRLTQSNVLQQAATSMLAQANQAPQAILQLLG